MARKWFDNQTKGSRAFHAGDVSRNPGIPPLALGGRSSRSGGFPQNAIVAGNITTFAIETSNFLPPTGYIETGAGSTAFAVDASASSGFGIVTGSTTTFAIDN